MNNTENWQTIIREQEFNEILMEWNSRINLVSRKKVDASDLIEDSKLFFSAIDPVQPLKILDLGTGGGFPGIVLAINFPNAEFTLVDSISKKIKVVSDIIERMNLTNARAICSRAEDLAESKEFKPKSKDAKEFKYYFDMVVSRSVAVLQDLAVWSKYLIKHDGKLVTLKGGEISGEIRATQKLSFIKGIGTENKEDRKLITVVYK